MLCQAVSGNRPGAVLLLDLRWCAAAGKGRYGTTPGASLGGLRPIPAIRREPRRFGASRGASERLGCLGAVLRAPRLAFAADPCRDRQYMSLTKRPICVKFRHIELPSRQPPQVIG